jgi:hypothetical protein
MTVAWATGSKRLVVAGSIVHTTQAIADVIDQGCAAWRPWQ